MQAEGKELENIGYDKTLLDSFSLVWLDIPVWK
jgi:hypothetical protein